MSLDPITAVLDVGSKIIDKIWPDKTEADKAKVRLAELAAEGQLKELGAYYADIQGARSREVEIVKATGKKDTNLYVLAWMLVGGFFALLATIMFVPIPPDQNGVVFMLFGSLASAFGAVIGYFFGSSKSSADKSAQLANLITKEGKK